MIIGLETVGMVSFRPGRLGADMPRLPDTKGQPRLPTQDPQVVSVHPELELGCPTVATATADAARLFGQTMHNKPLDRFHILRGLSMRLHARILITGFITTIAALAGSATATAEGTDGQSSTVEYLDYPQAEKIFQERGIKLKRGDGHITLVACGSRPGLIEIYARAMQNLDPVGGGKYCFRVTSKSGYLSMEVPRVYGAMGNDYDVTLNMATADEQKPFKLNKGAWTPVGKSADEANREFTLLEIVAKK
ncbi:hypothetical protein [Streptomyces sp. NPDC049585]|uniref:hypothetical protein n=1 Tax=Streptomyces sp. NPDC049585 TaxID=3155154 RepID=UPI003429FD06